MVRLGYNENISIIVTPDGMSDEDWAELEAEELDLFSPGRTGNHTNGHADAVGWGKR
jgi:hypothetical protein